MSSGPGPDWNRTNSVASGGPLAEVARRISGVTAGPYSNSGRTLFFSSFENGMGEFRVIGSGTAVTSTASVFQGANSCIMTTPATINSPEQLLKYLPPDMSQSPLGCSVMFDVNGDANIEVQMFVDWGSRNLGLKATCYAKLSLFTGTLITTLNNAGDVTLASGLCDTSGNNGPFNIAAKMFHTLSLAVDFIGGTGLYCELDGTRYTSQLGAIQFSTYTSSISQNYIQIGLILFNRVAAAKSIYVDNFSAFVADNSA